VAGREKRPLGDLFGLTNFGVNITRLAPGGASALRHAHTKQDELVYILEGRRLQGGKRRRPCLVNEIDADVVYLGIGDRTADDAADYPDDDLAVVTVDGQRRMTHKDGTPY
jgi:uncharacterized cupin superfamily protein